MIAMDSGRGGQANPNVEDSPALDEKYNDADNDLIREQDETELIGTTYAIDSRTFGASGYDHGNNFGHHADYASIRSRASVFTRY